MTKQPFADWTPEDAVKETAPWPPPVTPEQWKREQETMAHESLRERERDANARHPWVGWALGFVALMTLAGAAVRACW